MDKWPRDKLISEITKLEEKLQFYQVKLRDLVTAYKSLVKEKEALESSVKALQNVCQTEKTTSENQIETIENDSSDSISKNETPEPSEHFHTELTTLMNSLATLSAEKCRMEASFQADKKLLRQEKEKNELMIKELQEKLKRATTDTAKEIENLKSKLIIEKHEREKEQNDHAVMMRELQQLLAHERNEKTNLEKILSELTPKFQLLVNKEETDRYKETDMSEKLLYLQKKHLAVLESERKRMLQAEQESKEQVAIHERRVASLETRLTELSHTVANYHRMRQEDQNEITKLKAYIAELGNQKESFEKSDDKEVEIIKNMDEPELTVHVRTLIDKLLKCKAMLLNANEYLDKPVEIHSILCDKCHYNDMQTVPVEQYNKILHELDIVKQQFETSSKLNDEIDSFKRQIQVLQAQNCELNDQADYIREKYERELDDVEKELQSTCAMYEKKMEATLASYDLIIRKLEGQLHKQRDRTMALLDEKEQEVSTLKSSFQVFLPGNQKVLEQEERNNIMKHSQLSSVLDESFEMNSSESPHILHYAHELARKDVTIKELRKTCNQLESSLHELNKELILSKERSREEIFVLKEQIDRLERCQTREGANLEYLKNVIVNFLLSKSVSSKRHMFNAIAAVLKFSDTEINAIKSHF